LVRSRRARSAECRPPDSWGEDPLPTDGASR
jgi:hypothetical protein